MNQSESYADLVFQGGVIYTVSKKQSWAQALAIKGKRLMCVGSNDDIKAYIGPKTEIIELDGKMVLPGFIDSHAHASASVFMVTSALLHDQISLQSYQQVIGEFAKKHPDLEVIYGRGWDNSLFPREGPKKEDLDPVIHDRPVSIKSIDGHALWLNSIALKILGITKTTPDPKGGVIERDPKTGEPSGTLRESAIEIAEERLPPFTTGQMIEGIMYYADMASKEGITTVHDPLLCLPEDPRSYRHNVIAYSRLASDDKLTVRVRGALWAQPRKGTAQIPVFLSERVKHKNPLFQTNAVKIFIDGVVEGSTAYLLEPYKHMPGFQGKCLWQIDTLKEMCKALDQKKFQIHIHAIGDAATRVSLDAFEYARNVNGRRDSRHLITHLQLVDSKDIRRLADLEVIGVPQPFWFVKGDLYYNLELPYLGPERAEREYPMKSLIDAGAVLSSASDYPVTVPCSPLIAIRNGITRCEIGKSRSDDILGPEERVSLEEMIASYTINGAYANFLEKETGSLETGKIADLVIVDQNLFELPASEIHNASILMTIFEGKEVFRDKTFRH